jgi:hypothetical protein
MLVPSELENLWVVSFILKNMKAFKNLQLSIISLTMLLKN